MVSSRVGATSVGRHSPLSKSKNAMPAIEAGYLIAALISAKVSAS
jgi:hypothetical protein